MDLIESFFKFFYNIPELIRIGGLYGLMLVIFSETGLMVGFFLPGDSLLVTAGLFAARGDLNILTLIPCLIIAAICGNSTGYWIGNRAGKALYHRPNSFLFRREHLVQAHDFYERHGGKAITLAQFIPIFRTFTPVVAGAAQMNYRRFITFNVIGAVVWITSMLLTGYYLGRIVPDIEHRIHLVIAGVIFVSLLPALYHWVKSRQEKSRAAQARTDEPR